MYLNNNQIKAVKMINESCLVLAGAGSGKTHIIINKIIYLINFCNFKASNILAITFTNKAADEMKDYIKLNYEKKYIRGLKITNFHTLGFKIIKFNLKKLNVSIKNILLDEKIQHFILKNIIINLTLNKLSLINHFINIISNWKNYFISPYNIKKNLFSKKTNLICCYYKLYEKHLSKCNLIDFDDLIYKSVKLLKNNFYIRNYWKKKINYILIDEYQDTNKVQFFLIKLLLGSSKNITVVGDENQSIYSWRGAEPKNFILLKNNFPNIKIINLEQNYRSTKRIINIANTLISNNINLFKKKLFSELEYGKIVKIIKTKNQNKEADLVIIKLIQHYLLNKTNLSDYAILYRKNYQAKFFEKILLLYKIPYFISNKQSFFLKKEIKILINYLYFINNIYNNNIFLNIINIPSLIIDKYTLIKLSNWAKQKNKSLFLSILNKDLTKLVNKETLNLLKEFVYSCNDLINKLKNDPINILYNIVIKINYKNWLKKNSSNKNSFEDKIKNINKLIILVKNLLIGSKLDYSVNLRKITKKLFLNSELNQYKDNKNINKVQLMTLHSSKGLEFSYVFLVGMEEGILPHKSSIDKDNIQEERRLAYVGITRAKKELIFTFCEKRLHYGNLIKSKPSRFLFELPQNELIWEIN